MISFDIWVMQSMRENFLFLSKKRHLGRENQTCKMIALPDQYSSEYIQKIFWEKGILEKVKWGMKKTAHYLE